MWLLRGRSRVVNPLAGGEGGTSRDTGPTELISGWHQANPVRTYPPTKETPMRAAYLHYYLAQAWAADRYRPAQRDAPACAPGRAHRSRRSPRAHRARALPALVARRMRAAQGGRP